MNLTEWKGCVADGARMAWPQGCSMLWNFADSDPEFGYMQGKELQTTLEDVLDDFPVGRLVDTHRYYYTAASRSARPLARARRLLRTSPLACNAHRALAM